MNVSLSTSYSWIMWLSFMKIYFFDCEKFFFLYWKIVVLGIMGNTYSSRTSFLYWLKFLPKSYLLKNWYLFLSNNRFTEKLSKKYEKFLTPFIFLSISPSMKSYEYCTLITIDEPVFIYYQLKVMVYIEIILLYILWILTSISTIALS